MLCDNPPPPSLPPGLQLWSLTLQLQFYLAFPLALLALRPGAPGFRARLASTLAAVFVGGTAWRLHRAWEQPHLALPIGDIYRVPADTRAYGAALEPTSTPALALESWLWAPPWACCCAATAPSAGCAAAVGW